jgi:hypothetical protein
VLSRQLNNFAEPQVFLDCIFTPTLAWNLLFDAGFFIPDGNVQWAGAYSRLMVRSEFGVSSKPKGESEMSREKQ